MLLHALKSVSRIGIKEKHNLMRISNLPIHWYVKKIGWIYMVKDCLSLTKCFFLQVPVPICKSEKGAVTVLIIKVNHMNFSHCWRRILWEILSYDQTVFWIEKLQKGAKSSSAEKWRVIRNILTLNFVACELGRYTYSTVVQVQIQ